jgi:bifunctional enzyme Fae/Hps
VKHFSPLIVCVMRQEKMVKKGHAGLLLVQLQYVVNSLKLQKVINRRLKYLQVALNSGMDEARSIVRQLPRNERILVEAGTPLIKTYGWRGVRDIVSWWGGYVVADLKTMDRGETEATLAKQAGASGAIALGQAPLETLNSFIKTCASLGIDSMVDMMHVEQPVRVLRKLKKLPDVVILHRGVDEETFNRDIPIPYIQINKIRSLYDVLIAVGGGDTIREVQRSIFNGANIVLVWKEFYQPTSQTAQLAQEFLAAVQH